MEYKKGPYFAEVGDFGSAGAFNVHYFDTLPNQLAVATGGMLGYGRGLLAGSPQLGAGHLLYAAEYEHNDGPWNRPDDFNKGNAVLRYSIGDDENGFSLTLSAYHGAWNSSDQVARRAIGHEVDRWGSLDGTTGGVSVHDFWGGLFGSVRVRYFGPRSLIEDDSVRSPSTTIVNAQVGYKFNETWTASVDLLNLFNERSSDIDYYYTSRLSGEPAEGADDIHTHPNEPFAARLTVSAKF